MTEHLTGEQILCLLDGEQHAPDGAEHLRECEVCRQRYIETGANLESYGRYHRAVLQPAIPPPPNPWADLRPRFEPPQIESPRFREPRAKRQMPWRWLAAAAAVALAILVVRRFDQPQKVQAAELLRRASAAPAPFNANRRIRVQTRSRTFVRPAVLPAAGALPDSDGELRALFRQAKYNWEDPLSVRSYVEWREQLSDLDDEVAATPERGDPQLYLVRTTTSDGPLVEATIALRANDLHPVQGTLRFSPNEVVEISELPDAQQLVEPLALPGRPQNTAAPAPASPSASDELHVVAALHRIGADLGEPVEVERTADRILVTVAGLDARRREQIGGALAGLDKAEIRFADALPRSLAPAASEAVTATSGRAVSALLTELESKLGSRASVEQLVDRTLVSSDAVTSRAHALRALAQRFPPEIEAAMTAQDRALLISLAADHMLGLEARFADLHSTLSAAFPSLARAPAREVTVAARPWQELAPDLLNASRKLDELVNALLAPAANAPEANRGDLQAAVRNVEAAAGSLSARIKASRQ